MAGIFRERILAGRTAFVTGGGSGIGQRMAERFAEHGASVMLVGRNPEKLAAAATAIRSSGGTAETHPADVRDYPGIEGALRSHHRRPARSRRPRQGAVRRNLL